MRVIRNLILFLILAMAAAAAWIYSGVYNVAADQPPSKIEDWLLATLRHRSIEKRTEGITAPPLDDPALVAQGFELYRVHCVTCHGGPGVWPEDLAMGLYPVPPSLDIPAIQDEDDAELFWVIKNGIKLTGMPAFGPMHSEEELWSLVAFVRRLPQLSPEDYQAMAAPPAAGSPAAGTEEGAQEGGAAGSPEQEGAGEPASTAAAT